MEIVENYYNSTANVDNKDQVLVPQNPIDLSADKSSSSQLDQKQQTLIDSSILSHAIDLLCTLLKKTKNQQSEEYQKVLAVFP
mmetsp:Transcript_21600/g.15839  ORF Transcript_21600/g.15839 Transcript_21600/m.15839 type:complete len:83 (+) Transcript_21600:1330-1578(+)